MAEMEHRRGVPSLAARSRRGGWLGGGRLRRGAVMLAIVASGLFALRAAAESPGATTRESVSSRPASSQGDGPSGNPAISEDGRFVVFESDAANLVKGDANKQTDVFLRDRETGETTLVSLTPDGRQFEGASRLPSISGDGTRVAFQVTTLERDCRPGTLDDAVVCDTDEDTNVYVHDRASGKTTLESLAPGGIPANGDSREPVLSRDGRILAFTSKATNLAQGTDGADNIYVRDLPAGVTRLVSLHRGRNTATVPGNAADVPCPVGPPGLVELCLRIKALRLADVDVEGTLLEPLPELPVGAHVETDPGVDVAGLAYLDLCASLNRPEECDANGSSGGGTSEGPARPGTGDSFTPSISADGRFVAFASEAEDLDAVHPVTGQPYRRNVDGRTRQVYVRDLGLGFTTVEALTWDGQVNEFGSWEPSISGDGSRVAFTSQGRLVEEDSNDLADVYVRDRIAPATILVSTGLVSAAGDERLLSLPDEAGDEGSGGPSISSNGRVVAFTTQATVYPDPDDELCIRIIDTEEDGEACEPILVQQVLVRDIVSATTGVVSVNSEDREANLGSTNRSPSISGDGRYVAFESDADNLFHGDTNRVMDVFVRDRIPVLVLPTGPVDFPLTRVGKPSPPQPVTVGNDGSGPLRVTGIRVSGDASSDFTVADRCTNTVLYRGETCTFEVVFTPTAVDESSATLEVTSTAPNSPQRLDLRGIGGIAAAKFEPEALDFGAQPLGTSAAQAVTVQSVGAIPLTVSEVRIGGEHPDDFVIPPDGNTCPAGQELDAKQSCSVGVVFAPTAQGARSAELVVVDANDGGTWSARLTGVGTVRELAIAPGDPPPPPGPVGPVALARDEVDFGVAPLRVAGDPQVVTVANTGNAPVTVTGFKISEANFTDFEFREEDTCTGARLDPATGCTLGLDFIPTELGTRTAVLTVMSDADRPPNPVTLRGRSPAFELDPPLGPSGFVTRVTGKDLPPDIDVLLGWDRGLGKKTARTDLAGLLNTSMLILPRDEIGPRLLQVHIGRFTFDAQPAFLVVPGSAQPRDFVVRR